MPTDPTHEVAMLVMDLSPQHPAPPETFFCRGKAAAVLRSEWTGPEKENSFQTQRTAQPFPEEVIQGAGTALFNHFAKEHEAKIRVAKILSWRMEERFIGNQAQQPFSPLPAAVRSETFEKGFIRSHS
ncbi:hypothetical protein GF1_30750 [Desulfolithobacter dissulfuricans]|uniref:Uncharacterized protein n=1 Tax=Desulfolithobacter dissulfuricans TaxID=2795293 RepID=A0A915XJB5_9BACT|nr:hypothetical protein GF1_30750 [Desulfolithobacter dissulfuricans]